MVKIKFAICIFLKVFIDIYSQNSGWFQQYHSNTDIVFKYIQFIDENIGWVVGTGPNVDGIIMKTIDGGVTWFNQPSNSSRMFYDACFIDANNGWIVGNGETIINTTDGGSSWLSQRSAINPDLYLFSIHFYDRNRGVAVGGARFYGANILITNNGGINWNKPISYPSNNLWLSSVQFTDSLTVWATGYIQYSDHISHGGLIIKSDDGGKNWNYQKSISGTDLRSLFFINSDTGWVVGFGTILKTTDGGINWISQPCNTSLSLNSIHFVNEEVGWCTAGFQTLLLTDDGGKIWREQHVGEFTLNAIYFINEKTGWTAGSTGIILKTNSGGLTSINDDYIYENSYKFVLHQNFPNPFNSTTKISYSITKPGKVTLIVYDVLGKLIAILVDENKSIGNYTADFYSSNLSSGVYFYQMKVNDFIETKKMIILR